MDMNGYITYHHKTIPLRFAHMKTPDVFGRAVSKYFGGLRSQLVKDPPARNGFLKMLKEICDFLCAKHPVKPSGTNSS